MWIRCVETTAKTSAGINVEFDGTPTGFPLYICAKCEHIVQWVMMCTHTGCSLLWLVPFHFHQLRAVSAFAQVPFFFPFRKPPRCIHHFSLDAFAPFSSFLFGGFSHGARFCFCFPVSRLLSRPSLSSAGFSFRVLKKKKKKRLKRTAPPQIVAPVWQREESQPFTRGDSVGPGTDSVAISVDKESVRGSWDFSLGAKLLLFLPLVCLDGALQQQAEWSLAEDNRKSQYPKTIIAETLIQLSLALFYRNILLFLTIYCVIVLYILKV